MAHHTLEMRFYAGDKDIDVEMEMYGGKGVTQSGVGGEGYSRIRFTMKRDEEYILTNMDNINAPFLYRKATLIAVVGQGGAGSNGGSEKVVLGAE